jgi:hypothetical protein
VNNYPPVPPTYTLSFSWPTLNRSMVALKVLLAVVVIIALIVVVVVVVKVVVVVVLVSILH